MINAAAINSSLINGTGTKSGKVSLTLNVNVIVPRQVRNAFIELNVKTFNKSNLTLPILVKIGYPRAQLQVPLQIHRYAKSSISLPFSVSVFETDAFKAQSSRWKIKLILDDIDVSSNLTDSLRVEAEEGTAKIAEFTLMPFAGPIALTQWLGKRVVIYYQIFEVGSIVPNEIVLFQGVVDEPIYNPTSRLTRFICSDQLQDQFEMLTKAQIANLVEGYWNSLVFQEANEHWQYVQDLLSTVPVSADIDRYGVLKITPWASKATADFTFNENDVLYQSIEVQLANRREIHNQTVIAIKYRFPRLKQREIRYEYRYPYNFCGQNYRNSTLPNVDMIGQAIEGTGWHLKGDVEYVHQRGSGWVSCGGVVFGYLISEKLRKYLVRDAYFTLAKRYIQTITEAMEISVRAKQSIEQIGLINNHDSLSYESQIDATKFIEIEAYQDPIEGTQLDDNGDYVLDSDERGIINSAILTKLNQARTAILKSHRNNLVSFKTPLNPLVERHHTVKLDSSNVIAQGKVKHTIHECDFSQGRCETSITLSVSRTDNDEAVADSSLNAPAKISQYKLGDSIKRNILSTHLGGKLSSQPFDETWDGYIGNEQVQIGAKPYPEQFIISTPAIESEQAPTDYQANLTYQISVPNELLLLSA